MILLVVKWLSAWGINFPAVFAYSSTRMMLAAMTSLFLSIGLGSFFIRKLYLLKIGQTIRKEAEECSLLGKLHAKKEDTPTMGGALILFSMLVSLFLWMDLSNVFTWILLATTCVFGGLGGYDDYLKLKYKNTKGLGGKKKLGIQILFSALLACVLFLPDFFPLSIMRWGEAGGHSMEAPYQIGAAHLFFPFYKYPLIAFSGLGLLILGTFSVFVITGASNAVNLTDGLDGLAAGCLIMASMAFAAIAFLSNNSEFAHYLNIPYIEGSAEIAIYLCALIGGALGFLWYNSHPAQVFMGDIGSLSLGAIIGVSAVLLRREILLSIIGGIFVAEALSVILQVGSYKLRNKKRIFLIAPLHHHFEYLGMPETKVVIRFWIVALLLAIVGLSSIKLQ